MLISQHRLKLVTRFQTRLSPISQRQIQRNRSSTVDITDGTQESIRQITELTTTPLVPELPLHLITPNCKLWTARPEECPFVDPFWAFFWPGGQALCRYILDNRNICKNKKILDIGSGGGSTVIACLKNGAQTVVVNDIDPIAISVTNLNIEENFTPSEIAKVKTKLLFSEDDILPRIDGVDGQHLIPFFNMIDKIPSFCKESPNINQLFDVILIGDLFYDDAIALRLLAFLQAFKEYSPPTCIYIGDPGRHAFLKHFSGLPTNKVAEYTLPKSVVDENYGFPSVSVYQL